MIRLLQLIFILFCFAACNTARYLPAGKKYLNSVEIKFLSDQKIHGKLQLKEELNSLIQPLPNKRLLGVRYGVIFHTKIERGDTNRINKWLNKKYGEKPVWISQLDSTKLEELLRNRLENRGFFNPSIHSLLKQSKHSGKLELTIQLPTPYLVDSLIYFADSLPVWNTIKSLESQTLIKQGERFDLDILKAERERIEAELKNEGYYYFNSDNILFKVDTNKHNSHRFNVYMSLKENIPAESKVPFKIGQVVVFPNYSVNDTSTKNQDTTFIEGFRFIEKGNFFKTDRLVKYILIAPTDYYSKRLENLTSSRIGSLGTYKYVSIRFKKTAVLDSSSTDQLDATIYLSPQNKRSLSAELQTVWKSNSFIGPGLLVTYSNINMFKGGEVLKLTGKAIYEVQLAGGRRTGLSSIETGLSADYMLPRLIGFSRKNRFFSHSIPQTFFRTSFTFLERVEYYRLKSFLFSYGVLTNSTRDISHELQFPAVNFVGISKTTSRFDSILYDNPFLRKSYEQQFIIGLIYKFQYNQLPIQRKRSRFLILLGLDMAGNLIHLVKNSQEETFLGEPYARYVRVDADIRQHINTGKNSLIVARLFGGVGIPLGNSSSLPYIKQYFSGGPNSLRAFRVRSIGPGIYQPEKIDNASYFDQSGDIKIETNLEYRFPMFSVLKGALFMDAGNTWLAKGNPALPGGKFSNKWLSEIAVGVGYGFRFDFDFLVVRLDIATPLRKPFFPENNRWVTEFKPGYKSWRKENLIWNIAIGYPF
jgi:outer membrane protein insertion porin family